MKKLFLLISVFALSLLANATVTNISPTSPYESDALRKALYYSADGDTIVMSEGVYTESKSDYIAWKRSNVVMAAEGATVTIKPHVSFRVKGGSRAKLIGVKIDASEITSEGSYEDIFQGGGTENGNCLILENCEIYGNVAKTVVRLQSDKKIDSLIINNCYIHDNAQVILRLESTSLKGLKITNSTIANIANGGNFWVAPISVGAGTDLTVLVDHCTFYNNTSISESYADITVTPSDADVTISNCIFAQPATYSSSRAVYIAGGTVQNCLTYNYSLSTNGISGATSTTGCITGNPLFTNAASGDYSYAGNWSTGSVSPARGAGADGSDLGDPRWYTDETLPSTNFASAYDFLGTKALLDGNIRLNASNHIEYYDNSENGTAKWKLHIEKSCYINAVVDIESGCTSGRKLTLTVKDADGNNVGSLAQASTTYNDADINLGTMNIPEEGDYTFILTNSTSHSSAKLEKITLSYAGGDVADIPGTLNGKDALLVSTKMYRTENGDIHYDDNGTPGNEYAYWKINVTTAKEMEVRLNVVADPNKDSQSSHQFSVSLYSSSDFSGDPIQTVSEASSTSHTGTIVLPTKMNFTSTGTYYIKLDNTKQWSSAILGSIRIVYVGGAVVDVPGVLNGEDAVLVDTHMTRADNGDIQYGDNGNPSDEYAYWKIHATEAYSGKIILNIPDESTTGHIFRVGLYSSLDGEPISEAFETAASWSHKPTELSQTFEIPSSGDYFIRLDNEQQWSSSLLRSIIIATNISNIDEAETDIDAVIGANDGKTVNVQLTRSLVAGMYNTICLPFAVSAAEMARVFPGATVKELTSSSIEGGGFVLNLNFEEVDEMEAGVPYIIKPASDISNPKFIGVTIDNTLNNIETSNADFIGNFVVDQIPASEDNLFLGASNTLYFPTVDMKIKGMRAYFQVKNPSGAPIRQARIVEQGNVATEIEIAQPDAANKTDKSNVTKRIENGQLLIIREGVQYDALGVRVK